MRVSILGAGKVGTTLGGALAAAGHELLYGVRDPADVKHDGLRASARVCSVRDAAAQADAVILSTPWAAAQSVLAEAGDFGGRPLLDATNPIGPGLELTHGHTDSGGEQVQRWAPSARVVKVFNTTGLENMADPRYPDGRVAMFLCGDDDHACEVARTLCDDIGFLPVRVGPLARARILEPAAMLWIRLALVLGYGRGVGFGLLARGPGEHGGAHPLDAPAEPREPVKIAILGTGRIGAGLGRAWARAGHEVVFGARDPAKPDLQELVEAMGATAQTPADAVRGAHVVVLAVPWTALDEVLGGLGELEGQIVIDCTNAVERGFTLKMGHTTSAAEELQRRLPGAHVFKSFNAQGAENLANPTYDGQPASNFFCGDDAHARAIVRGLVADVGFDPVDAGPLKNARLLEPMMVLWILSAQATGTRDLAFRLMRR